MEHRFSDHKHEHHEHQHRFSEQPRQPGQLTYINGLGFLPETPRQAERRALIAQYNILLFAILLLFFLRTAALTPVIRLLALLGLDITINPLTHMVTMSMLAAQIANMLVLAIYLGLPALVILLFGRRTGVRCPLFVKPYPGTTRSSVLILLGTGVIAIALGELFTRILEMAGLVILQDPELPPKEFAPFLCYCLASTLLPAVLEEVLFRGAVLHALRRFGDIIAISVSTILYTLSQPSLERMVYAFVLGLALAYFTLRSGSLLSAVAANFLLRTAMIFLLLLEQNFSADFVSKVACLLGMIGLLLSLVLFAWFIRRDDKAFQIYSADTYLTNRTKVRALITNFGFWMVVVLALLQVIPTIQLIG